MSITPYEQIPDNKKHLFFKSGKAKKTYCTCTSPEKIAELKRLYGQTIIQCAGCQCPFYSIGCGRENIQEFNKLKKEGKI